MFEGLVVGSLFVVCWLLYKIHKELWHFSDGVHMRDISINDKKKLVEAITTIASKVEVIDINVSCLEEKSRR